MIITNKEIKALLDKYFTLKNDWLPTAPQWVTVKEDWLIQTNLRHHVLPYKKGKWECENDAARYENERREEDALDDSEELAENKRAIGIVLGRRFRHVNKKHVLNFAIVDTENGPDLRLFDVRLHGVIWQPTKDDKGFFVEMK